MSKVSWKPGTMVYPLPAVMVSCGDKPENYNIITIAWTGTINTNPPMCYISVRPERHSYDIIKESGEFVINLTTKDLAYATDWCGVKSGRDFDKFKEMKLTPSPAQIVKAPLIEEAPINIECKVTEIKKLGSHDMFIAEVVNIQVSENYINKSNGTIEMQHKDLMAYSHGKYIQLGDIIEQAGFSIKNKH